MKSEFRFERNGFDLIRYWATFSVMLLHFTGYAMMLMPESGKTLLILRKISLFFPGVVVLFALSGYLVMASMDRLQSRKAFFRKRVLRMYPELWLCTLVNLAILICMVPERLDKSILIWIVTQVAGIANTPECLKSFATGSVNGALWTIFVEVQLYVVLAFSYRLLKKLRNRQWLCVLCVCVVMNVGCDFLTPKMDGIVSKLIERLFFPYLLWFLIGVFCYLKREWFFKHRKAIVWLLCIYGLIWLAPIKLPGYYSNIAVGILCPFIVVVGGFCLPPIVIKKDITYGLFLYHWIILNLLIHFQIMSKLNWMFNLMIFFLGSVVCAGISNYCGKRINRLFLKKNR